MMKQEPVAFISPSGDLRKSSQAKYAHECGAQFTPLYANQLPAQQIPEGLRLVPDVPNSEMISVGLDTLMRSLGRFSNYRQTVSNIWEDMLSASQPKGDV